MAYAALLHVTYVQRHDLVNVGPCDEAKGGIRSRRPTTTILQHRNRSESIRYPKKGGEGFHIGCAKTMNIWNKTIKKRMSIELLR